VQKATGFSPPSGSNTAKPAARPVALVHDLIGHAHIEPTAKDLEAALHLDAVLQHIYGDLAYDAINQIAETTPSGPPPVDAFCPSAQSTAGHPPRQPPHLPMCASTSSVDSAPASLPHATMGAADTFSQRPLCSAPRQRKPGCGDRPAIDEVIRPLARIDPAAAHSGSLPTQRQHVQAQCQEVLPQRAPQQPASRPPTRQIV